MISVDGFRVGPKRARLTHSMYGYLQRMVVTPAPDAPPKSHARTISAAIGTLSWTVLLVLVIASILSSMPGQFLLEHHLTGPTAAKVTVLDPAQFPIRAEIGKAKVIDISALGLQDFSDAPPNPRPSSVLLLEDGVPLTAHSGHDDIRNRCDGCFSHWQTAIYFSPRDGNSEGKRYSLVYGEPEPFGWVAYHLPTLTTLALIGALLQLLCGGWAPQRTTFSQRILVASAVFLAAAGQLLFEERTWEGIVNEWSTYSIYPDSIDYVTPQLRPDLRQGLYPWFVRVTSGCDEDARAKELQSHLTNVPIRGDATSCLLRVVRAQKVLTVLSFAIVCFALSALVPAVVVMILGILAVRGGFFVSELGAVLSEPLAQVFGFLAFAALVASARSGRVIWLWLLALACAMVFHVRPAGIYSIALLACGSLYYLSVRGVRRGWLGVGVAGLLFVAAMFGPALVGTVLGGPSSTTSLQLRAQGRVAIAAEVMTPDDFEAMPDEGLKRFFTAMWEAKQAFALRRHDSPEMPDTVWFAGNISEVAEVAARKVAPHWTKEQEFEHYLAFSNIVLKRHIWDFAVLVSKQVRFALSKQSRFGGGSASVALVIIVIAMALSPVAPPPYRWMGLGGITLHLVHIIIVSAHNMPLTRYTYATELFLLGGFLSIGYGVLLRFVGNTGNIRPVRYGDGQRSPFSRPTNEGLDEWQSHP